MIEGALGDKSGNLASQFGLLLTPSVRPWESAWVSQTRSGPWVSVSAEHTLPAFGSTTTPCTPLPSRRWWVSA